MINLKLRCKKMIRPLKIGDTFKWNTGWDIEKVQLGTILYLTGADTSSWRAGATAEREQALNLKTQDGLKSLYDAVDQDETPSTPRFTAEQTRTLLEKLKTNPEGLYFHVRNKGTRFTSSTQCDARGNVMPPLRALSLVFDESKMLLPPVPIDTRATLISEGTLIRTAPKTGHLRIVR